MSLLLNFTLKSRINKLRKLINSCTILEENKRDQLVSFIKDEKKMYGIDINGSYGDLNGSLLIISCAMMDYDLFEILLSQGADPNITKIDLTLEEVIYQMVIDLKFYKYLKKRKTNFNDLTSKRINPLSLVIGHSGYFKSKNEEKKYNECINIIDFLINEKVDVNLSGEGKLSPLMIAARDEAFEIIDKLVLNGANSQISYYIEDIDKSINCIEYIEDLLKDKENSNRNYNKVLEKLKKNA